MTAVLVPRINLDAPAPRAPLFSILGAPDAARPAGGRRGWQGGARLDLYPPDMPTGFDPCSTGTLRMKDDPEASGVQEEGTPGFTVYLGDICTSWNVASVWEAWKGKAEAALEARTAWALERQLAWAGYETAEHYLGDADMVTPNGTSAVAAKTAVAYLDDWLSQFGERGVISLTPAVATYLGPDVLVKDGQQLRTQAGTPVIVGTGYEGTASEDLSPIDSSHEAAAGESWIFAHAPVLYEVGELIVPSEPISEVLDRDDNTVVFRVERQLWVGFDGDRGHAGVLADWSP